MRKKLKTASIPRFSSMEEDLVFAEVEYIVNNSPLKNYDCYDVTETTGQQRRRQRYSLVAVTAIVVAAVTLPAGLITGQLLAQATHRSAAN